MERYERAVAGQREGEEEQGGEVPVPGAVAGAVGGMAREAASSEQEAISGTGNAGGHGAAESESDDEEVNKVIFDCSDDASDGSEFRNAPFLTLLSLFIGAGRSDGGVGGCRSGGQCQSWGRLQERPERGP
jgi:hypothetical protein